MLHTSTRHFFLLSLKAFLYSAGIPSHSSVITVSLLSSSWAASSSVSAWPVIGIQLRTPDLFYFLQNLTFFIFLIFSPFWRNSLEGSIYRKSLFKNELLLYFTRTSRRTWTVPYQYRIVPYSTALDRSLPYSTLLITVLLTVLFAVLFTVHWKTKIKS